MNGDIIFILIPLIAIVVFYLMYDKIRNQSDIISSLHRMFESYRKELSQKEHLIADLKSRANRNSISSESSANNPTETHDLKEKISALEKLLSENKQAYYSLHINYLNLESSYDDLSAELEQAKNEYTRFHAQSKITPSDNPYASDKVEFADHDFLLQELGRKNKQISHLLSEVAPLHSQIDQLKEKLHSIETSAQNLDYLRSLYPNIDDILAARPPNTPVSSGYDYAHEYLSEKEWYGLSESQRNQLALDRYIKSHKKTKWQIGRDYELYVAHKYSQQGYVVDPCGSYLKLEDMGRDLILTKGDQIRIVQCKYWSERKEIHWRFIFLLYGSVISYCIEHNIPRTLAKGIFVTNIRLSPMARQCAEYLGIIILEQYPLGEFPRIKCNVIKDSAGEYVYIYHLPMDPQYDRVKIKDERECYAYTVEEAESYGFRRAKQ